MAEQEKTSIKSTPRKIDLNNDKPIFSWQAEEFTTKPLDYRRMALMGIAFIVIAIIFGLLHQWSGVAVVIAGFISLVAIAKTKPNMINCALYRDGVVLDQGVYSFDQFKSFWMVYSDIVKVRLQLNGRIAGQVTMPLSDNEDPEQIRLYLSKYLPEEEDKGQDLSDMINHWLRF